MGNPAYPFLKVIFCPRQVGFDLILPPFHFVTDRDSERDILNFYRLALWNLRLNRLPFPNVDTRCFDQKPGEVVDDWVKLGGVDGGYQPAVLLVVCVPIEPGWRLPSMSA